ncbi:MAG: substrate-binding domain-containing protein [Alphaproteobacteria bacterium]|nr:substrate-binding domain-containing protein [Alphaproteobacteria bacterium]
MATVAQAAGVSGATVDRVLNRRGGVKSATAARVLAAAVAIGYLTDEERHAIARPRPPKIAFLIPAGTNPYLTDLGRRVRRLAAEETVGARLRCAFIESFRPEPLVAALRHHARWADAIAFMAIENPLVRDAVDELAAAGKTIVTIVSDVVAPGRAAYVGLDNVAAGRTAGYLMGRFHRSARGAVGVIAGSLSYRAHAEREMGFHSVLQEMFGHLTVIGAAREGHDDRDRNYAQTRAILDQVPGLTGLYNVGGASDGVARALQDCGRARDVILIGHGMTPDTRALLMEGTIDAVLNANPEHLVTRVLAAVDAARSGRRIATLAPLPMDIVLRENLPPATS